MATRNNCGYEAGGPRGVGELTGVGRKWHIILVLVFSRGLERNWAWLSLMRCSEIAQGSCDRLTRDKRGAPIVI